MEESLIVKEHVIRISVTRLANFLQSEQLLKAYIDAQLNHDIFGYFLLKLLLYIFTLICSSFLVPF